MPQLVDTLAVCRLTRLITKDTFPPAQKFRDNVLEGGAPGWAAELVECPWCISFWVALGVGAARRLAPRVWDPVAKALAASFIAGALVSHA